MGCKESSVWMLCKFPMSEPDVMSVSGHLFRSPACCVCLAGGRILSRRSLTCKLFSWSRPSLAGLSMVPCLCLCCLPGCQWFLGCPCAFMLGPGTLLVLGLVFCLICLVVGGGLVFSCSLVQRGPFNASLQLSFRLDTMPLQLHSSFFLQVWFSAGPSSCSFSSWPSLLSFAGLLQVLSLVRV